MSLRHLTLAALCVAVSACGTLQPPQAWQRGLLAKPEMRLDGDPLQQRFDQHIQMSKENASGGTGVGGGGCGCN
ncbi:DUF4266 domain-containing protein [Aquabacterium sp.]|uniref:DUF4266 domain-containing protein n=1 Tax=Aquabacterium sp. TaxID=1872578 RepID=UPI002C04D5E0|nr:DUF4266 domain-containing protein [Aquabacterium sp.]HSW04330.1 DUF4266 domain-containing protein [Aquabacterium sp.]